MTQHKHLVSVIVLFVSVLGAVIGNPILVHAQTGMVCIADVTLNAEDCPFSPAILTGSLGSTLTVAVNVQDSNSFNGFDIQVIADPAVLRPLSVSLTGTVLPNAFVLEHSVNVTSGVARAEAVAFGSRTTSPATGRLFSITYQVVANNGTAITFPFGCPGSSNDSFCVTVVLTYLVIPENLQTASFGQTTPDFAMAASPDFVDVAQGSPGNSTITLASLGEFAGTVSLSTSPTCIDANCPSWYITLESIDLIPDGTGTTILIFSALPETPTGTWPVTIFGQSGDLAHSVDVIFNVTAPPPPPPPPPPPTPDFALSAPHYIPMYPGTSDHSRIYLFAQHGFVGNVTLTAEAPDKITTVLDPTIVVVNNNTVSSNMEISIASDISLGTYSINVTGTSGTLSHTSTIFVTVFEKIVGKVCIAPVDSYSCPDAPPVFTGTVGSQLSVAVNVQGSNSFNAFDIQVSTDPAVLRPFSFSLEGSVLQNPSIVPDSFIDPDTGLVRLAAIRVGGFLTTAPTTGRLFSITYNITGTSPGTAIAFPTGYSVSCTTSSNDGYCVGVVNSNLPGFVAPEDIRTASFANPPPDFTITASPPSIAIPQGGASAATITLTSLYGFGGTITLSGSWSSTSRRAPSFRLTPTMLTLVPDGTATSNLVVSARSAGVGTYTLTITATGERLTRTLKITIIVISRH